ncbi:MAG: hypothetical protein KatS3mg113_0731 [Planctomycetaceae bacterium]|nr:MAG: hypothetical protein KatS3mg113_0731 [Planctomycetaceae bacterium]
MQPMQPVEPLDTQQEKQGLIILLRPEIITHDWGQLEKLAERLIQRIQQARKPDLIVDLTPLNYLGSAHVALLVRLYKTVEQRRGRMVVVVPHPLVKEVLQLAGLDRLWALVSSRDDARKMLGWRDHWGWNSASVLGAACLLLIGTWLAAWLEVTLGFSRTASLTIKLGGCAGAGILASLAYWLGGRVIRVSSVVVMLLAAVSGGLVWSGRDVELALNLPSKSAAPEVDRSPSLDSSVHQGKGRREIQPAEFLPAGDEPFIRPVSYPPNSGSTTEQDAAQKNIGSHNAEDAIDQPADALTPSNS